MDFMELSKKRVTLRKFSQKPVEEEKFTKILEAASLDLGSVWISYFDEDRARELLHLPEEWQSVCMLCIGYPAEDFVPNTSLGGHRKPLEATCFRNKVPTDFALGEQ